MEIDDRAAQLAAFALLMKARADDRSIFANHILPNVLAMQESKGLEKLLRPDTTEVTASSESLIADHDLFPDIKKQLILKKQPQESPLISIDPCVRELIKLFEHGKTFGSLISVPPELAAQLPTARQRIEGMMAKGQLWEHRAATFLLPLVKQAELLARTYEVVVANPPYMGGRYLNKELKEFASKLFPESKSDTFAMFIERGFELATPTGHNSMVTMEAWMFLSSYQKLRDRLLKERTILSLVHMPYEGRGRTSMGINFGTSATVFSCKRLKAFKAHFCYIRHTDIDEQGVPFAFPVVNDRLCYQSVDDFIKIPGSPIAYWVSDRMRLAFQEGSPLGTICEPRVGLQTGDNDKFVRLWWEPALQNIGFGYCSGEEAQRSRRKWFPYNKGGDFRKWYGNHLHVVNWFNGGVEIKSFVDASGNLRSRPQNIDVYFRPAVTWSFVSSAYFGVRRSDAGFVFDVAGSSVFPPNTLMNHITGFLCTNLAFTMMKVLNPSLNFQVGDVARLPFLESKLSANASLIERTVEAAVEMSRLDWDSFETSYNFKEYPLLVRGCKDVKVESSFNAWTDECRQRIEKLRRAEEELNRVFLTAYSLDTEITADVKSDQITLAQADREQDIQRLISYAIGCMMGRYSLDKPGLVYAHSRNEGFDPSQYRTFHADADGIIPLTEVGWFPNDATERVVEFIAKAWPSEHLEENLKFIGESISANKGEQPRETIRRYLATGFYKDHLQTYKKRPIYWLFSSGKQRAFQCLVYLHRYHEGTLARMRTEYVIPLQGKMTHRIEQLASDILKATSTSHRIKLEKEQDTLRKQQLELQAFDEKLRHFADQRISLELDDGVKVNYGRFGELLAEVKAICGKSEDEE